MNAHATSTPAGDLAEYRAIVRALPHGNLRINSTKSMIGHLMGAAGAVEAVAAVMAIKTGYVHPNLNLTNPDPDVNLDLIVGGTKLKHDVRARPRGVTTRLRDPWYQQFSAHAGSRHGWRARCRRPVQRAGEAGGG